MKTNGTLMLTKDQTRARFWTPDLPPLHRNVNLQALHCVENIKPLILERKRVMKTYQLNVISSFKSYELQIALSKLDLIG